MTQDNPLLDFSDLPRFADIRAEHVGPAIAALLEENRAVIAELEKNTGPVTWDKFVEPLEDAGEKLNRAWSIVSHLHSVVDTPEMRAAYNENQPAITEFSTEVGQNLNLFAGYKSLRYAVPEC